MNKQDELINSILAFSNNSKKDSVIIAIDGRCASGKTTFAEKFLQVIGNENCNIFHADDFFLQSFQRTKERFLEPGGNIDYERLESEVILPTKNGLAVHFRKFDCSTMSLQKEVLVPHKKITLIEGSYSLHPSLQKYYDLKIFFDIEENLQRERIINRNKDKAQIFFEKWIPLEEKYFSKLNIKNCADFVINN